MNKMLFKSLVLIILSVFFQIFFYIGDYPFDAPYVHIAFAPVLIAFSILLTMIWIDMK